MIERVEEQRRRRLVAALLSFLLLSSFLIVAPVAYASPTSLEQCFLDKINQERAAVGVASLQFAPDIEAYSRQHSQDMAGWGQLIHSDLGDVAALLPDGWILLGENIGWQSHPDLTDCTSMHEAFMASPGHRDNLLDSRFNYAATGTYIDGSGGLWTTHVFFGHPNYSGSYNGLFADDDGSVFEADIEIIAEAGITSGCSAVSFCPYSEVTRGQMAAFLERTFNLAAGPDAGFSDTAGIFKKDIDAIAHDGITSGCGNGKYCPGDSLTRAQMAVFLYRALDLDPAPSYGFSDTRGHRFEAEIDALAAAGITLGCGGGQFCPYGTVTRGQMAAFLARALDF